MTQTAQTSLDALATRAKIAVIVPATNTVVQPEMEAMRPNGVTNHHEDRDLGEPREDATLLGAASLDGYPTHEPNGFDLFRP